MRKKTHYEFDKDLTEVIESLAAYWRISNAEAVLRAVALLSICTDARKEGCRILKENPTTNVKSEIVFPQ